MCRPVILEIRDVFRISTWGRGMNLSSIFGDFLVTTFPAKRAKVHQRPKKPLYCPNITELFQTHATSSVQSYTLCSRAVVRSVFRDTSCV